MRLIISAVESSGDRLGAALYKGLNARIKLDCHGICGPKMREAGIHQIAPMESVNVMGIAEAALKLPSILKTRQSLMKSIHTHADVVIGIDGPDFHLPVLKKCQNTFRIGVVSPQIWAWRPERSTSIANSLDMLLCLFDFEPPMYPKDFDVRFIGHPIVDWYKPNHLRKKNFFGLAPGSRPQELKRMWPIFLKTAKQIKRIRPQAQFVVSAPVKIPSDCPWIMRSNRGAEAYGETQATLTKSGTITLELALMNVPIVVAHQVNPLTHWISKRKLAHISHIALPNILSQSRVAPEYRQDLDPKQLANELLVAGNQSFNLESAGKGGAIDKAVNAILEKTRGMS